MGSVGEFLVVKVGDLTLKERRGRRPTCGRCRGGWRLVRAPAQEKLTGVSVVVIVADEVM